ncbi:ABC transporter permease, partial [Streptomyces sp. SID11233]|nr:ABC transporter permease [Streptomyces sp. SID11233]
MNATTEETGTPRTRPEALPLHAEARRMTPARLVRHTGALTWRLLVQLKHNPEPLFLLGAQPILFLVLITYIYGGQFAGSTGAYLQYALPGVMVYNAVFATMSSAPSLFADIGGGVFDRFRSMPIARSAPLIARVLADLMLQAIALVFLLAVGFAMGFRIETGVLHLLCGVVLIALFSVALAWLPMLLALSIKSGDSVQMILFVTTFPLSFISGAFARVDTMPGWLQALVKVNPVTWLAQAERALLTGGPVFRPVLYT